MIALCAPLALLIAAPLLYLWWRLGRGPREVRLIRLAIVLLVALTVADLEVRSGEGSRHVVLLVDRSLSCGREALARAAEVADLLLRRMDAEDRLSVVTFGRDAMALSQRSSLGEITGLELDDASDLTAGLNLSAALLGETPGGRVLVVSDGLYTGPDPLDRLPSWRTAGAPLDYSPVVHEEGGDVAISAVELPERVRAGHPFELAFTVHCPAATEATLGLERGGAEVSQTVSLGPGEHRFTLQDVAGRAGLLRYVITATAVSDSRPQNNRALAVTMAVGPPRVLVLNDHGGPDNLTRALAAAGADVTVAGTETAVSSAALKPYSAAVLENVALGSLNDRADVALRNFVRETGGGLLVTGGRRSFAEGGYYQSRLEEVLPVSVMREEQYSRAKIAMAIVLDRSGSMSVPVGGGLTKMALANRAAAEAVGVLMPQDEVAAIAVDSMAHLVVPLAAVGAKPDSIIRSILAIESMGGGIFVYTGLTAAVNQLLKSSALTRHIVLFADANDSEEPGDYKKLVDQWVGAGGSISVIGLGTKHDSDAAFLIDIASRGGGQVFFTADPRALPRVFCQDAIRVARKTFLDRQTGASVHPEILRLGRLQIDRFPDFLGYNLCYGKEEAVELVTTTDEHMAPVLAVWQRGLGRAAALTCEADGAYTGNLRTWSDYKPFFSSLVTWLERSRDDPALFATIRRTGRTAAVSLEMDAGAARTCTGATAVIIPPDERDLQKLPMRWMGPQRLAVDFKLETEGIYHGMVLTNEGRHVSLPAVVLPYSPEFAPVAPSAGLELLEKLAAGTGGTHVLHVRELLEATLGPRAQAVSAAPILALMVLMLVLCDIATRKHIWRYLIPRFAATGYVKAGTVARAGLGRLRGSLRRLRARARRALATSADEAAGEPEAPAPGEDKSVFEGAKRRSRPGREADRPRRKR